MKKLSLLFIFLASLSIAQEGARYLIITHDNFYNVIQPLAEWKNLKGMKSKVVRLSEIGSSNTQIKNYILNAYNTWNPRPEFILLVGSADYLPSFFRNVSPYSYDTDNEYANMSGDYQAELCYGRFPAKNIGQCSTMVAKTLNYERTPYLSDTNWYRGGSVIVNEDGSSDDTIYWNNARFAATQMLSVGYTKIDTFSRNYGHSATNVVNAVTQGRTFVLYRGGGVGNWYSPFAVNPGLTNNGNKLPVICSFTCATMTIAAGESMVGDAWVRAGNPSNLRGAVAFVGNTHSGTNIAPKRGAMTRGFFYSVFTDSNLNLGTSVIAGKKQIWTEFADQYEYEGFNLLGDPELCLWTAAPQSLDISYANAVPIAPQDFSVTVNQRGIPVTNALVCVTKGQEVYAYGYTNSSGQVTLTIAPTTLGNMTVTVTARNCLPHEGITQIVPSSGPYPIYFSNFIDDPMPGGNNNGDLNPGEAIHLRIGLKNVGSQISKNVMATIRSTEPQVIITDSIQYFGDIQPDSINYCQPGYAMTIAPACTNQQYLNFSLSIQDSAGNYSQNLNLVVHAGKLAYQNYSVTDPSPGGNNNGRLDPGESGQLLLTLQNVGSALLYDVQVKLRTTDRFLTITDSTGHFDWVLAGETKTNTNDPIALSISPQAYSGYRASVQVIEKGIGRTYETNDSINLMVTVGQGSTNAPTGPDAYGYYVYDNTDINSGQAPTYNWVEINTIGQTIPEITNSNDAIATFTLPFTFRYYGQNYDSITAASNGYLALGTTLFNSGENNTIFNGCPNLIAPFWDNLDMRQHQGGNGDAYRYYDAVNHRYIIEYLAAAHYGSRWTQETFQTILLDPAYYPTPTGDGEIIFQYASVADASSNTIGFCDRTQTRGIQLVYNGEYDPSATIIAASQASRVTTVLPTSTPAPWLGLYSMSFSDSLGNNNGLPEPGENLLINLSIQNIGQVRAENVNSVLRNQDADVTILDSLAVFGNIEPGASANNSVPYLAQISSNPTDSIANFALILDANSGNYSTVLYFSLNLAGVIGLLEADRGLPPEVQNSKLECLPNPFTRKTLIKWQIPAAKISHLKFQIYSTLGRLVVNHLPQTDKNCFFWDGTDLTGKSLPKGLYFLVLTDKKENRIIIKRKIIRAD
jgi:hypothetical protein